MPLARISMLAAAAIGVCFSPAPLPAQKSAEVPAASPLAPPSTPPAVLEKRDLDKDLAKVLQQLAALETILRHERAFAVEAKDVSDWSVGLQAAHSTQVLATITREIGRNLADPSRDADKRPLPMGKIVLDGGNIPRGIAQAPLFVMPLSKDPEHWLGVLAKLKEQWTDFANRLEEIRTGTGRFKHFSLGHFDSAEWVRFVSIHTAHHMKIVRDILKATGEGGSFPPELSAE